MAKTAVKKTTATPPSKPAATTVTVWEDDPGSGAQPTGGQAITVPVPDLEKQPLALTIKGKQPPAKVYPAGSAEFRYWTAAACCPEVFRWKTVLLIT